MDAVTASLVCGKLCAIVDDVISTGATLQAMRQLIEQAGGIVKCVICAFTEGMQEEEYISLGTLPCENEGS